ncbi:MAG TPA: S8 family serine peptidase [Lentimicrobium sp.]|nr:S8 family serine peptidase [Lentimicrobium sp.]
MKKYIFSLFLIFAAISLNAQSKDKIYVIKLKDKGEYYTLSDPSKYLSDRAIERRLLQQIPLNQTDLPVNPEYITQIKSAGGFIIYTSKWLNTVIIRLDDQNSLHKLQEMDFITSIYNSSVLDVKRNQKPFKRFFQQEKYEKINTTNSKSINIGLNYGPSANQAQMIKIDQLHNQGYTGEGVVIAVIDAGFNSANTMDVFDSLFLSNRVLGTRDFVQPGNNVFDGSLSVHGTMVLSTMAGNLPGQIIGTAPHASYYLFRSEDATAEYLMEEYYWVNAAEYADSLGVDVINTSLGYTRFDNPAEDHTYEDMDGNTTPITIGADLAAKKGMLVINSAGNEGANVWHYISAPADGDSVMAVGAVDPEGNYAYFSSVGPTFDGRIKPDVATQGYNAIVATIPSGIAMASGTSFSSPILTGAAACLWQANPTYNNMEIYNAIKQSASQASNPDNLLGWGIPDFLVANSLLVGNIDKINYSQDIKCYPNPFNDYLIADFFLSSKMETEIRLINSQGKVIQNVKSHVLDPGKNHIKFDKLQMLPKGIYFIKIISGGSVMTQKVIK